MLPMADPAVGSPRTESAIRVDAASKSFEKGVRAVDAVDLEVGAGEFFTLLGPSGCGKTTLLRLLAGLEQPDSGRITIGGQVMDGVPPHRRSVNTVFQSYALFPHRNVRRNIGFGLEMRGTDAGEIDARTRRMAELIGIDGLLDREVAQLSGGQRQRVALARALINEPDVLLLDEPLSALDADLRGRLQLELKRLQRRLGMTFVFVTHDQQEAMVMSDRMAVLDAGRIVQVGPPDAIYEAPAALFVARFMGHQNFVPIHGRDAAGVDTPLGRLEGAFGTGDHLLLRPETIRLGDEAQTVPNRFEATVEERLYRGETTEYRLACGGLRLLASRANRGQPEHQVGETIRVGVSPRGTATVSD
ncbi:Fe3+/spermidine/putrescine ABC transporter ATP-binding protein [Spiribacter roseus]|jgi:spermidine/putrescine transport system ATP-binding protein|nr:Fe3+/spermidine/putrescine ABC transporter ATP-binding protein [Spiribacter roseus]KAF0283020.1 Fe3+/spermidine/putrescine ABC transporter ATP-binding protein [Spiribacter roseus]KAF0286226.1 Fe3+/spermidine/putrescine ABC transporter ATP-binding protein [Spiribacter sp. SSL99]